MRKFFRDNGLTIVLMSAFLFSLIGQFLTGHKVFNDSEREHGGTQISYVEYIRSGHFIEATFENWESEFLQMSAFIILTAVLYQKGSGESRKPGTIERVDIIPHVRRTSPDAPWPVRKGGLALKLYEHSLSLALMALFAISFWLHAYGGVVEYNREQIQHNGETLSTIGYIATSQFWFESFQNWQSEFLSVAAMIVLSIFLRQKGSPESKPVDAPHTKTAGA